ncbi:hypothetical protein [Bifidobacterium sp. A11]|uniref:hypothetical protein n=1 Tax=Bifidobacterium sp. A11 TaxID=1394176 RepID=UPI0004295367|nr:hypothetical protein [Bifidobacterium sp. A11]
MSSILDRTPLLVSRKQARQLAAWAKATGYDRPALCRISKQGKYAYYTNRFIAIRWDVSGLDVPDDSWIDLQPAYNDSENTKPDILTNMAQWSRAVGALSSWDLMDAERWREPDDLDYPDVAHLFTRARTGYAQVSFNAELLEGVILAVMPEGSIRIMLAPSIGGDSASARAWWVMSEDERVAGMIVPMRMALGSSNHPDEAGLPEPYKVEGSDE